VKSEEQGAGSREVPKFLNPSIPQFIQLYQAVIWPCKAATRSGNEREAGSEKRGAGSREIPKFLNPSIPQSIQLHHAVI
jgi:hypothetical protein